MKSQRNIRFQEFAELINIEFKIAQLKLLRSSFVNFFLILVFHFFHGEVSKAEGYNPPSDAIVHLFNYPFSKIEKQLPEIADTGFRYIQISPPQLSREGKAWYYRYQPLDYRIIDGPLGTKTDLKRLIDKAREYQIGIIADVVLNHMADLGEDYDLTYPPKWVQKTYGVSELFNESNFHPAFCIDNYNNQEEVRKGRLCKAGESTGGLPDLDLTQEIVFQEQVRYLDNLSRLGIAGFRFDAAKHMEIEYFQRIMNETSVSRKLVFAEIIAQRQTYDKELSPYLSHTNLKLMDFPLQTTMKDAFSWQGDLRWLFAGEKYKAALPGERSISFVVNHDIPNNREFEHLILDEVDEALAHIFLFARAGGTPHIYSDLGKSDGLSSNRWKDYHKSRIVKEGVKFHNLTYGASEEVLYADSCAIVIRRGREGVAAINKCSKSITATLYSQLSGEFIDLLSGDSPETLNEGRQLILPGRSGQLYIKKK